MGCPVTELILHPTTSTGIQSIHLTWDTGMILNMSFEREGLHVTRARNNMKIMGLKKAFRGFSIIELLIAVIIIGILVAIIIPRLVTRSLQARIRAAESDLEEIRKAEEHAAIDTGYYYRLYVLDDNPGGGDGIGTGQTDGNGNIIDVIDSLRDEQYHNNNVAQNPIRMFICIDPNNTTLYGNLYPDITASQIYYRMTLNETAFGWNGRYITWHKDNFGFTSEAGKIIPDDIPDDPWGHDYLFFTSAGLVLEPDGNVVPSCNIDANGKITWPGPYNCMVFDRFVVLSLGPNGLPGDGSVTGPDALFSHGDDIIQKW